MHALVRQWVIDRPDAEALRDPLTGTTLSYAALWERSGWVAAELAERGVGRGAVVAVTLARSADLVVALLGILRAGAAYLPVDAHAPTRRVAAILAEAAVSLVIGTPKGVVVPHRAVVRLGSRSHYCVIAPGERCANGSSPAFDASTFEIWGALAAGGTVVVLPSMLDRTLDDWVSLVRAERVDTMFLTTSMFHAVARERPDAFGTLANLVVGGEQLELTAVRRVLETAPPGRLVNGYGPTETTTFAAYFDCTAATVTGIDRISIGFPLQDNQLSVLDEELRAVAPGVIGEPCIGGPGVALGYLGRPELTAERFVTEPGSGMRVYRTGDLARQLPAGAIELLGRRDRQVKLRGFRIELDEIEASTMATGLCDAVVVEKVGDGPAAYLAGFVLPAKSAAANGFTVTLSALLADRLPQYMVPTRWTVLDAVPFGPTGKVDRTRLLVMIEARVAAGSDARDGGLGQAVREICRDVLTRHEILRTTYRLLDGSPVQVVGDAGPVEVKDLDPGQLDAEITRRARVPFDLATGPMLRCAVWRGVPGGDSPFAKPAPKSLRRKSGRKPGGQLGHPGSTLALSADPDKRLRHEPGPCSGCGADLMGAAEVGVQRRQVFDLPPITVQVTEHQLIARRCRCGAVTCGMARRR